MPEILPFIPLISSVVGVGASLIGGNQAQQQNQQVMGKIDSQQQDQTALINQLMAGIDKNAYMQQAQGAGSQALGQLSADDASRGLLNSGAHSRVAAQTLGDIYTQANAKYQSDRQSALGMALGGHQNMEAAYGQQYNPNPYSGLGSSLGAVGTQGSNYLNYLNQRPQPTPLPSFNGTGVQVPGSNPFLPAGTG